MSASFNYFENCTFCQTRIGSTDCLLPFQLTRQYIRPQDDVAAIIDLTEIHTTYGIHALKSNFEIIHWIKNRPTANQIQEYSTKVLSRTQEWYFKNDYLQNLPGPDISARADSSCQTDDSSNNQDPLLLIEKPAKIKAEPEPQDDSSYSSIESKAGAVVQSWSDQASEAAKATSESEPKPQIDQKTKEKERKPKVLDRMDENHLIQDLLLAIKAAYNQHFNPKSNARIDQLHASLDYELNIKGSTGSNYKASFETSLDSSKLISKEIVARHSVENARRWEMGDHDYLTPHCILAFPPLDVNSEDQDLIRIESAFTHYFNSIIVTRSLDESQKTRILSSVEFELQRCDYKTAFTWINGKIKLLRFSVHPRTKKYSFQPEKRSITEKEKSKSQMTTPYPTLDQKLLDHMNSHLQVFVNQSIEKANGSTPTMRDETKISKFIFTLASEFLKRNKG